MSLYNALGAAYREAVKFLADNYTGACAANRYTIRFHETGGEARFIVPTRQNTHGGFDIDWISMDELTPEMQKVLDTENAKAKLRREHHVQRREQSNTYR